MRLALHKVGASALLAGLGAALYAALVEPRRYRLETISLGLSDGSPGAARAPLKILHLSDLHLCYPESHKLEFLKRATDQDYDLVALTGDIVENYSGLIYLESLLSRRPRLGAYAVLGNHDYYDYHMFHKTVGRLVKRYRHPAGRRDVEPIVRALERGGFTVLRNAARRHREARLHVVGIDYPSLHPELLNDLVCQKGHGDLVVVLFHVPIHLDNIARVGADLALGGHTHGGQIRIPGLGAIITDSELPRVSASGVFQRGQTTFHVSRGLGADPRTNIRFFCPPAATVIEVVRTQPAQGRWD